MIKIIVHWLLLIVVLAVNALANILPINGFNTGQISGFYPNYFVPAGFTFGIWSIIYLLLIAYSAAFSFYYPKKEKYPDIHAYLEKTYPLYWLTCLCNAGWILAWHYLQMFLSVAIMMAFLGLLITIFLRSLPYAVKMTRGQRFLLQAPMIVYLGWISVATIANITAMLVHLEWQGGGISGILWSILMMLIAIGLSVYIGYRFKVISYELVIAWALWGIYKGQGSNDAWLSRTALIGSIVLLCLSAFVLVRSLYKTEMLSGKNS
jgi:hypothetical protein